MRKVFSLTLLAAAVALLGGNAQAAAGKWTQLTSGGFWSAGGNWEGGTVADNGTADFNTINITADNTVHLDGARTITGLTFGDTVTSSGSEASWILDNDGNAANTLTGIGTITVNALGTGKSATISAVIAGTSPSITKLGNGTLVLSGANTFTKASNNSGYAMRLTAGTVIIASDSAFGTTTGTDFNATTLINLNGATLQASGSARTVANPIWLNVASTTVSGDQSITFSGTVSGRSTNPTLFNNITGAGTLSLNNVYTDNLNLAKTLTFDGTGNTLITGVIANNTANADVNGNIIKSGAGTLTLSNINTYTGTTAVNGGKLLVNSPGSLHARSAVTVANTAILGGSGTINGTVSVNNGGTIQPTLSGSVGMLTLANAASPTFNATGTLKIRVPTSSAADQVYLSNSAASFACNNLNLVIDVAGLSGNASDLTIVSTANPNGVTGTFPSVTLINNTAGYTCNPVYSATSVKLSLTGSGPTTYTVTFNNNGGSGTMTAQTGSSAAALTANTFTRTGYTFAGWNTVDVGGGTEYADGASYPFTASTTLYAQWTANTYTVTFDGNGGGTPSPTSTSVTYASTYGTLATVTRSGYTFNGWFTAASGGTQVTSGTTVAITGAQTLYAQWTIINYTVSFNMDGGTPTISSQSVPYNTTATQPADPTKASNAFGGWYSDAGLTTSFSFSTLITAETPLYAKWTPVTTYTVSFTMNGGTPTITSQNVVSGSSATQPADPTKTGYTFGGWYTDAGLTTAFSFATAITVDTPLYAKWTIIDYTVSFTMNGGSPTISSQSVPYNTTATQPADPTKTGNTFGGWYSDAGLTTSFSFSTAITATTTLYAKWTVINYTVSFTMNGGSPTITSQSVAYNTTATQPAAPTKTGNTFGGWYSDAGLTTSFNFSTAITADTALYAKWTPTPTITLADTLAAVNTTYGTASATPTSFHVSGSALTGNLTVTPPSGYEVSLSSGSDYTTSLSITASGTLESTQVYVRLAATTGVVGSPYSGTITVSGGGASSQTIATASSTVAKADATVVVTPYTVNYDDSPHSATVTSITGVNGETDATVGTVTLNTTHTTAGIYASDSWTFTPTANYNSIGTTTTTIIVQNGSFETGFSETGGGWARTAPVWNPQTTQDWRQFNGTQFFTAPQDGVWSENLTDPQATEGIISQDLLTTVSIGDVLSVTFYLGREKASVAGGLGGAITASFLVGAEVYSQNFTIDTNTQLADSWVAYTFTTAPITHTGNLRIKFEQLSDRPWIDNISNVSRTSGTPQTLTDRINNLPTSTGASVTMKLNTTNTFAASDFKFADGDVVDTLSAVKVVTSLPTHGTLKLNGTPVALGDVIPVANIGTLTYTPTAGYTGADSFKFQVSDGMAYSADATMTITVTPPKGTMVSFFGD